MHLWLIFQITTLWYLIHLWLLLYDPSKFQSKFYLKTLTLILDTSLTDFSDYFDIWYTFDYYFTILQSFRPHLKTLILDTSSTTTTFQQSFRDYFIRSRIYDLGTSHDSRLASKYSIWRKIGPRWSVNPVPSVSPARTIVRQKFVFRPASSLHDRQQPPRVQRIEDWGGVEVAMGVELARVALGNATFYRVRLARRP